MKFIRSFTFSAIVSVMVVSVAVVPTVGCSKADVQKAVSLIQAEIPTAIALIGDIAPIVLSFTTSETGNDVSVKVKDIQTKLGDLQVLCQQYNATPSKDAFTSIVNMVDTLVTDGDSALLEMANIKSDSSQQKAQIFLGSLSAVLHIIDGYVQGTQSVSQVKATAARRTLKLNAVRAYWSTSDKKMIESSFNTDFNRLYIEETALGF